MARDTHLSRRETIGTAAETPSTVKPRFTELDKPAPTEWSLGARCAQTISTAQCTNCT